MRRSLKETIQEREMRRTGGMPESASFHSKGYRRYFEGYSEFQVTLPNGKRKIERVYTGVYHTLQAPEGRRGQLKAGFALLFILAAILFFWAASRYLPGNTVWYITFPEAVGTAFLFLLLIALAGYLTAPRDMTLHEYRAVGFLKKASLAASMELFLLMGIRAIYAAVCHDGHFLQELECAAAFLAAAVCCLIIYLMEKNNIYRTHLSSAPVPDDAHEIHI